MARVRVMARVRAMPPTCREVAFMDMSALVIARVRVMPITPTPTRPPSLTLTRCGTRCHEALRELEP